VVSTYLRRAYQLIESASVAEKFTPIGVIPTKESHVRPLLALESDDDRQAQKKPGGGPALSKL